MTERALAKALMLDCVGVPVQVIANRLTILQSGEWVLPFWRERGRSCTNVDPEM